jgi:hypothetical protein
VVKKKELEDKAKAVLDQNKNTYMKTELLTVLKWKLGNDFNNHKDKRIGELQALYALYDTTTPPDILLSSPPQQPSVPIIDKPSLDTLKATVSECTANVTGI